MLADITEYKSLSKGIYLCGIGGIPIKKVDNDYFFCNNKIEANLSSITELLIDTLGMSGYLTYENKSNLSIKELGQLCVKLGDNWATKWFTLSFLFIDNSDKVELSFLRDRNFYAGWSVNSTTKQFVMNGSLSAFRKYCKNAHDKSFDKDTRNAMLIIQNILDTIYYGQ